VIDVPAVPPALFVLVATLGLVFGSFLNVCIYRLPLRESLMWPGSRCTSCGRTLSWYDNIPVVSWAVQRARCRTCGAGISWMYPLVEVATAAVFVGGVWLYGLTPLAAVRILFACALIVLFVIDLQHQILPNSITLPGIAIGFACSLFLPPGWRDSLLGILVGGAIPLAIAEAYVRLRGIEGLGMGDVKMLGMVGAFLGWKLALLTLLLGSFAGSVVGLSLIAARQGSLQRRLPFGTFLAVAAVIAAVAGDPMVAWYAGFYE
jgi:leader peptidase (prepilin peptidase) / N-methyltransferase